MDSGIIGWTGGMLLAVCGLPQAVLSYRSGNSDGISWMFLWAWFIGEVFLLVHVWNLYGLNWLAAPLLVNYALNVVLVGVILRYKIWTR